MAQQQLYPALSTLISAESLPEAVSNFSDALFSKIFYKNYYSEKSIYGDVAYHNLTLVFSSALGFNILGGDDGLQILFNPGSASGTTELPVSFYFNLPILKYINNVSLKNLDTTEDYFKLIAKIFGIPIDEILAQILTVFLGGFVNPAAEFVSQFNADPDNAAYTPITLTDGTNFYGSIAEIIQQLEANTISIVTYIVSKFIALEGLAYTFDNIALVFEKWIGSISLSDLTNLFIPKFAVALPELELAMAFPRSWLKPVDSAGNIIAEPAKSLLKYNVGSLTYSTDDGFDFIGVNSITFDKSQIGDTGFTLQITDAKFDFSRTSNIPEADAAGYPVDFVGVYVQQAVIGFSKFGQNNTTKVSAAIIADNLLIGTGGISGTIRLEDHGLLHRKFGNFEVELDKFSITFRQNAIVDSSISGKLILPDGFSGDGGKAEILIDAFIHDNGDFAITAKVVGTPPKFTFPDVFELIVRSLTIGEKDGRFFVSMAGTLNFIANLPVLGKVLPSGVEINKLLIWDDGTIEFKDGGLIISKSFSLKVGPVKLEVSHLAVGAYHRKHNSIDRNYYYFGFDGMINAGNAGVAASGNGIKYYFTYDVGEGKPFDHFLSIAGIEIDMTVPGNVPPGDATFILKGFLSMKNPDPDIDGSSAGTEYTGAVTFKMPKLRFGGSAAMRLTPSIPAFVVDIGLEMSIPIPLASTGLGIYGFRGLIGQHYLPAKSATTPPLPDTASWWEYYKAKSTITHTEGIQVDKFGLKSGFSIGAGISLATVYDAGYTFSSKLFLLLGLPDVFLIQGQATIISTRLGLADDVDPPFSALIVFADHSVQGDLGVDFNLPGSGSSKGVILSLQAHLSMGFFFNNASAWYLNIGKDVPETEQIKAKVLSIFQGHSYTMLSSQGFKAGAGISFDFHKKFGIVEVAMGAYLNMGGFISFKPVQIGGFIEVGAYASLKVLKFRLSMSIALALSVEAPHPFNIIGSLRVKVHTPWPLPKINFSLEMSWRFNNNQDALLAPVAVLGLPDPETGYMPAVATNIMSEDKFTVNYVLNENAAGIPAPGSADWKYNFTVDTDAENVTIPLDCFIDIELLKPVKPGTAPIGGANNQLPDGYMEMLPPKKGVNSQVRHEYELTGVGIFSWDAATGSWEAYRVYEAVTAIVNANTGSGAVDLAALKPGYWQFTDKNKYNKIRLLSQNMFSFMAGKSGSALDLDASNFQGGDLFCFENIRKENVADWTAVLAGTGYPGDEVLHFDGLNFLFGAVPAVVEHEDSFAANALQLSGGRGVVTVIFPEPVSWLSLEFGDNTNDFTVSYIRTRQLPGYFGDTYPVYDELESTGVGRDTQGAVLAYDHPEAAFDRLTISLHTVSSPDYEGDLLIGGHFGLPAQFLQPGTPGLEGDTEQDKALLFTTLYNRSLTAAEVLGLGTGSDDGVAARWPMDSRADSVGSLDAVMTGSPDFAPGFLQASGQQEILHNIYAFSGNDDALVVPYDPALKVENGSFALEITVVFERFPVGMITLLSRVAEDSTTGYKRGFALHLVQDTPGSPGTAYTDNDTLPGFKILLTCYNGTSVSGITATGKYTVDCATGTLLFRQYKQVVVSIDRSLGKVDIYIDRVPATSVAIPAELAVYESAALHTFLNRLTYVTEVRQARQVENGITKASFIDEVDLLDATMKTVQPVWRPDTTFAVQVKTQDRVNGNVPGGSERTHIFGFKTAGPLGHFHQHSKQYRELAAKDQADSFKLANLLHYIDYERSYPDAQGRYDLSKPVFCHNPQVKMFFLQPYMNAMFAGWNSYNGLAALESRLDLQLLDPSGEPLTQHLVWDPVQETPVDSTNFKSLPEDQQVMYLFNQSVTHGGCNPMPSPVVKRLHQSSYQFDGLLPGKLYTALFSAVYGPVGATTLASTEVHRFGFRTSRFNNFQEQAGSYALDATPGAEKFAVYTRNVAFAQSEIDNVLKKLINDDTADDPAAVLQYAVKFDRLVYGGLKIMDAEPFEYAILTVVINTDPGAGHARKILGIILRNPEPLNEPRLPADKLADTVKVSITLPDNSIIGPGSFITIHSRDTSSVFITNAAMDIPPGKLGLDFRQKIFNGQDYDHIAEEYQGPAVDIVPYF